MVGLVLVPKREGEGERGSMNSSRKFFAYARMDEMEGKSKREREREEMEFCDKARSVIRFSRFFLSLDSPVAIKSFANGGMDCRNFTRRA